LPDGASPDGRDFDEEALLPTAAVDATSDGLDLNAWNDTPAFISIQTQVVSEGAYIELQGVFSKTDRGLNIQGLSIRVLTAEEKAALLNGSQERCAESRLFFKLG
jgi:hypothetical protein